MELTGFKVAVIGAGIGGLAAARALALRGAEVTVLEQAPEIREVGAGLQLSPNALAVMDGLGLLPQLRATGAVEARAVVLHDQSGSEVLRLDLGRLQGQEYRLVHRADLISVLGHGARDAGARIRLLQRVEGVTEGEKPEVALCNRTRLRADLVIGADGLHSRLRPSLNGEAQPFFTGQVAWRATVPGLGEPAEARLFMGPGRHLVTYPLRNGALTNIVAVREQRRWTEESWSQEDDPETLRRVFSGFGPEVHKLLSRVEQVHLWGLFRHPVARHWTGEGVALLGDAAHPTLPFMAQGAAMALEDAWVLADALADAPDRQAGLALYQARRASRAARVINTASKNAWKYHLRFPPLRMAGHMALRLAGRLAPGAMVHQFDWIYAHDVTHGKKLA
ncbi:FAD-dependent oxidoreductase [Pseudooceanicola nanhaiensis]|uniref:FAD-dependent oxidoreductase n=1 Tax=Pseudooceanicola nanhaiensis TaxID=375761 RepID=UPI001CD4A3C6|nr:FAD-dependent oxidoreductase [Pseudooceanicola nanhaiensis]MCA0920865.1 FAD-dependent monooxygenase [Pseudooceanicola nanhaiensis]